MTGRAALAFASHHVVAAVPRSRWVVAVLPATAAGRGVAVRLGPPVHVQLSRALFRTDDLAPTQWAIAAAGGA